MKIYHLGDIAKDPKVVKEIVRRIRAGDIFIYPTDTLYGLGCNALKKKSVEMIRKMKRSDKPFSVIAPSMRWILANFIVDAPHWVDRLPGPYTLIVEKKKPKFLKECSPGMGMGIRIPNHYFTGLVSEAGVPFVTTSVNISGEGPATKLAEMPVKIASKVQIMIDDGKIARKPSTIVDLRGGEEKILRR